MSLALESVRETLGMRLIDDPAKRLVAQKIIELRQRGLPPSMAAVARLEAAFALRLCPLLRTMCPPSWVKSTGPR
jgi:hypothetical protein